MLSHCSQLQDLVLLQHQVTYQTVFSHCNPSFISFICDHFVIDQTDHSFMYPSLICPLSIHPFIHHPPSTIHHPPSTIHHPPYHPPSTLSSTIHPHDPLLHVLGPIPHTSHTPQIIHPPTLHTHLLPPAIFCCRGAGSLSPWRDQRLLKSSTSSRISP